MSKRFAAGISAAVVTAALGIAVQAANAAPATGSGVATGYTVVAEDGVPAGEALAAITAAGGTVVSRTDSIGVFQAVSSSADFASKVAASAALVGAATDRAIGQAPRHKPDPAEQESAGTAGKAATTAPGYGRKLGLDPLDDKLWGLKMVRSDEARKKEPGDRGVTVGILDTGLDGSHPDLAPNFDRRLSRNFAKDMIDIDGACEVASCLDPVGTDDGGHGTHVAGIVGAAANGTGISGVAPKITLVEVKVGQDSGYFFLNPVVNGLVYAGDAGLDVVNMSFYVDPWLFNCKANEADSPAAQAEQNAIIKAMDRALRYAHRRGVTLLGALGNNHENLGAPRTDISSPDYGGAPYPRPIDNATCFDLPIEGAHVIGVSSVGPSGKKSDFSNYGTEQVGVAAPGGWFRDGFGTPTYSTNGNQILSTFPLKVLQEEGRVDAAGNVTPGNETLVFKVCPTTGPCAYYRYLQGTSMAAPHAAGVAALIVSRFGKRDHRHGGLTLDPDKVEQHLYRTAAERACPEPRLQSYANEGRPAEFDAYCAGNQNFNAFYGYGMVDAYAAVTTPLKPWLEP